MHSVVFITKHVEVYFSIGLPNIYIVAISMKYSSPGMHEKGACPYMAYWDPCQLNNKNILWGWLDMSRVDHEAI